MIFKMNKLRKSHKKIKKWELFEEFSVDENSFSNSTIFYTKNKVQNEKLRNVKYGATNEG